MSTPSNHRASELLRHALEREADPRRCGVCDEASERGVCRRCAPILTAERFGNVDELEQERRA